MDTQENPDGTDPTAEVAMGPESINLEALKLQVAFSLGAQSLSFQEVANAQPGYVFELPQIPSSAVSIEVNGTVVGKGEIVLVGDRVGVRMTEKNALSGGPNS